MNNYARHSEFISESIVKMDSDIRSTVWSISPTNKTLNYYYEEVASSNDDYHDDGCVFL